MSWNHVTPKWIGWRNFIPIISYVSPVNWNHVTPKWTDLFGWSILSCQIDAESPANWNHLTLKWTELLRYSTLNQLSYQIDTVSFCMHMQLYVKLGKWSSWVHWVDCGPQLTKQQIVQNYTRTCKSANINWCKVNRYIIIKCVPAVAT